MEAGGRGWAEREHESILNVRMGGGSDCQEVRQERGGRGGGGGDGVARMGEERKREGQKEREESHEAAPLQYFMCSQLSLLLHLPLPQHPQDC